MLVEIIQQQHHDLKELFARHQEALLEGELDNAIFWLEQFNACLKIHMQLEEQYLFPEFAKIERKSKWDVTLYEKEHEKIRHLYKDIDESLQWLSEQEFSESDQRRNIIALLDKEKTFKGLNEHHEDREEEALLKELDEQLNERQLKELKLDINLTWAEARALVNDAQTV